MKMDRVRTTVTNIFGRVPLTYTRFSLTPQTDGDSSQVEMKLADEEECGDQPLGDHLVRNQSGKNGCKSLCFKVLIVVLLFLIGFLIGYLTYRGRIGTEQPSGEVCSPSHALNTEEDDSDSYSDTAPAIIYWSDLRSMFQAKMNVNSFETNLQQLCRISRDAGADSEETLAKIINEKLSDPLSKVWNDEHYVTLQESQRTNKITLLKDDDSPPQTFTPNSYVAYSPAASVNGSLVYGRFGTERDFEDLRAKNIDPSGKLILLRSGSIPFSEKVRNAERVKALGVLIYPDPDAVTVPGNGDIESLFGHAHFGTGDPFTPGFPSFNHTQFPPSKSSGLPQIPVQTLSSKDGRALYDKLESTGCPETWQSRCKLGNQYKVKLDVSNNYVEKKIYNVFGVIKGFDEPDRYVVVGAQRDSMGMGASKAFVGTSLLVELARMISEVVKDGYKPRRSIVFASWGAGDFGAVGATEWLEGYLTTLHLKTISYISLDAIIQGSESLQVSASPLMYSMIQKILKGIQDPVTKNPEFSNGFSMDDAAYPFLTYSGIPSASFRFQKAKKPYAYLGTEKDTYENFRNLVNVNSMYRTAADLIGQIILRLTHDHSLPLDVTQYKSELFDRTKKLDEQKTLLTSMQMNTDWMSSAMGDFSRAATMLKESFSNTDLENKPFLRSLNDRVMKVEHSLLSPYVSPKESPFRHILYGSGNHTFDAVMKHLDLLKDNKEQFNEDLFRNQLALLTWTLQSAANALEGEIWEIDNEF